MPHSLIVDDDKNFSAGLAELVSVVFAPSERPASLNPSGLAKD